MNYIPLRRHLTALAAPALLLFVPPASASQPEDQLDRPVTDSSYQQEINVRLVTLPLIARGRRGAPVTDLSADEVTIREGKKLHPVESLSRVLAEPNRSDVAAEGRLLTPLGGGEGFEISSMSATEPRYMILLLDLENDSPVMRKRTALALQQFVEDELDPSIRLALLAFSGDLRIVVPFTENRKRLVTAIEGIYMNPIAKSRAPADTRIEHLLQRLELCEIDGRVDPLCVEDSMREHVAELVPSAAAFVDALWVAVEYAAGVDGHKSIVTVGGNVSFSPAMDALDAAVALYGDSAALRREGFSLDLGGSVRSQFAELLQHAYANDTSLNFIDTTPAPSDHSVRRSRSLQPGSAPLLASFQRAQHDLLEASVTTGGAFVESTDVEDALRTAVALMSSTYYLSFYLFDDEPLTPDRLRKMSIESHRPGVRLEYRRAFEGWRGTVVDQKPGPPIEGAIALGPPVHRVVDGEELELTPLRFVFEPHGLGYEERNGEAVTHFSVTLRIRSLDTAAVVENHRQLRHSYPLELWRSGDVEPPTLLTFADLPAGEYTAEVEIHVPGIGRRGTLRRQFEIAEAQPEDHANAEATSLPAISSRLSELDPYTPDQPPVRSRADPDLSDSTSHPAVSFARRFLGIVAGVVDVAVVPSAEVSRVELALNGERAALIEGDPWSAEVNLGDSPTPGRLTAIAYDPHGRAIGSATERINLPRSMAEVDVTISNDDAESLIGHITYDSVTGEDPLETRATVDGSAVPVTESLTVTLPDPDMGAIHVLRVEALFSSAGTVTAEVTFGGRHAHRVSTRLSSAAIRLDGRNEPPLEELKASAGQAPVPVVAIDEGEADLIVVVDPAALRALPRLAAAVRPGVVQPALTPAALDERATPAESGVNIRLLWPAAVKEPDGRSLGYRLFPSSSSEGSSSVGGLIWHLAGARFPELRGSVRLADAVATAGPMAAARGRRRAVLLLFAGSPDQSEYSAAAARRYLSQLGVPLTVWSLIPSDPSLAAGWGRVETITHRSSLRRGWAALMRELARQRIIWVEGDHLPQEVEVTGPGVASIR